MKKILIISILSILLLAGQGLALNIIPTGPPTDDFYKPLLDMFSTGANSGLATSSRNEGFIGVGAQMNMAVNPEESILANPGNTDNYLLPLLYANIKFGRFVVFARGLIINQDSIDFQYVGGGLSFTIIKGNILLPKLRVLAAYHMLKADDAFFKVTSMSAAAVLEYKLPIPLLDINVFASAGYERSKLTTSWNEGIVGFANIDFEVDKARVAIGADFKILAMLSASYEFTVSPNANHNISVSVSF